MTTLLVAVPALTTLLPPSQPLNSEFGCATISHFALHFATRFAKLPQSCEAAYIMRKRIVDAHSTFLLGTLRPCHGVSL